jgi:hypothetical protein
MVIGICPKFVKICANPKRDQYDGRDGTKDEEKHHDVTSKLPVVVAGDFPLQASLDGEILSVTAVTRRRASPAALTTNSI